MTITWEIIAAFLVAGGAVAGGFWRIWGLIDSAKKEAVLRAEAALALTSATRDELHQHKLHAAETFVSKAGLREVEDRIMDGLGALGLQITGMSGRIDRMMERPASRRTAGQG